MNMDDLLDFDPQNHRSSVAKKNKNNKPVKNIDDHNDDMRGSILMKSRRPSVIKLESFELKSQLGRGTFGKVFLAELKGTNELYAIKVIRKDVLLEYD